MKKDSIRYVSCPFDLSGYGNCARQYLLGMYNNGMEINLKPVTFEKPVKDRVKVRNHEFLEHLMNLEVDYDTVLCHLTPEWYKQHREPGKNYLGYNVWETSKLYPDWVKWMNDMNGIMVASKWNKQVYKDSGVTVPIRVVPHAIDIDFYTKPIQPDAQFADFRKNKKYVFYTIGQFTARKNLNGLLSAFLNAFNDRDDVALVIKTFGSDYSVHHQRGTMNAIEGYCVDLRVKNWKEKVFLITSPLTDNDIAYLHQSCNAYISPHRGEGAGIPLMEAATVGNPVISTGYGGSTEFLTKKNSYLVPYSLTPVRDMSWIPWYKADQLWAEPDLSFMIDVMRHLVDHQEEGKVIGKIAAENMKTKFNPDVIGKRMIKAIKEMS